MVILSDYDFDKIYNWIDRHPDNPECLGNWMPSLDDLYCKILPLTSSLIQSRAGVRDYEEGKRMLTYLMWLDEHRELMEEDAAKRVHSYLADVLALIETEKKRLKEEAHTSDDSEKKEENG